MTTPRTVFFDGQCQLCSREIGLFRRLASADKLAYVDIADPAFDAAAHGVDPVAVHRHMHVRTEAGELVTGVDALVSMWEAVPGFRWLARATKLPVVRTLARPAYEVFAWVRPKLPKRRQDYCDTGKCRV